MIRKKHAYFLFATPLSRRKLYRINDQKFLIIYSVRSLLGQDDWKLIMGYQTELKITRVMRELVKLMKTQKAVAQALNMSPQLFGHWLGHEKDVLSQTYIKIIDLLKKEREKDEKTRLLNTMQPARAFEEAQMQLSTFTYSQHWKLVIIFIEEFGHHQGIRSDLYRPRCAKSSAKVVSLLMNLNVQERAIYDELRRNFLKSCDEVHGRIDQIVAKLFNLKNKDT